MRLVLALALAALLAVPAVASAAAPDRTIKLTSATASSEWDGAEGDGNYEPTGLVNGYAPESCTKEPENYCDITLINVESATPVTLDATIGAYSQQAADFDLYIYKSDATGKAEGDALNDSYQSGGDSGYPNSFEESATVENLEPGYYLMVVAYYQTLGGSSYHGTAKVTGATPVAGGGTTTGGGTTGGGGTSGGGTSGGSTPPPAPQSAPPAAELPLKAGTLLGSAKKAKKAKKLSFKVTAGDNITNLTVLLVKGKKVLGKASIASLPKGTRKITLKVAKSIKAGTYQLTSQGTVNGQTLRKAQKVKVKK